MAIPPDPYQERPSTYVVQDRVEFRLMDALRLFELSGDVFDLTNLRFALSFLRTWEWPPGAA
jgi:hypothetical protein